MSIGLDERRLSYPLKEAVSFALSTGVLLSGKSRLSNFIATRLKPELPVDGQQDSREPSVDKMYSLNCRTDRPTKYPRVDPKDANIATATLASFGGESTPTWRWRAWRA